ncbi:MAG: hypothetical protein AB7V06_12955 [Candidatus Obscuribacterales bacterium]
MKADESLDTIKKLERNFDDESVERALASLDAGAFDGWMISKLLAGRGATLIWPKIEQRLKQNLSLTNIARLAEYLPRNEVTVLLDQVGIDDSHLIDQIKDGRFPPIRLLPKERRERIYDKLRNIVRAESSSEHASTLLLFLLDFDRQPGADRFANEQSLKLATEWCLRIGDEQKVEQVLSRLLWMRPSQELLQLAEAHLYNFAWTMDTTFLLTGLMEATRRSQKTDWIDRWYKYSEPHGIDGWVISQWIRTTNCSRRALVSAKDAIRFGCPGRQTLIRGMTEFLHRKSVHRWMDRFMESNINRRLVRAIIPDVISRSPTKHHCALAKQAMQAASDEESGNILLELIKFTRDSEVVDLAKERVHAYPNAPESFTLMCEVAKSDSAVAVPWIKEWIAGALPDQVGAGLTAVIAASPTTEHLQMARDWFSKVEQQELPVSTWRRARLLEAVLKGDSAEDTIRQASALLEKASDKTHPALRKLARRLSKTKDFVDGH